MRIATFDSRGYSPQELLHMIGGIPFDSRGYSTEDVLHMIGDIPTAPGTRYSYHRGLSLRGTG